MTQPHSEPSWWRAALASRCPRCGEGAVFEGFLKVRECCPVCGLPFGGEDTGDGPVALIVLIVGSLVIVPGLIIEARGPGWPIWLHMVVWLPVAVLLCLALLRPFKAGLLVLQYKHRRHDFDAG